MNVLALLGREIRIENELGHAENPVHRRTHLVAHVRQEFALGTIGGLGGIFGKAQFALHALPVRRGSQHISPWLAGSSRLHS